MSSAAQINMINNKYNIIFKIFLGFFDAVKICSTRFIKSEPNRTAQ